MIAASLIVGLGLLIQPAHSQQANGNSYTDLSEYLISGEPGRAAAGNRRRRL